MTEELLASTELLRRIYGIAVITKTMASACPLAEMVARSGIEAALPQFPLTVRADLRGDDFRTIVRAGNFPDW